MLVLGLTGLSLKRMRGWLDGLSLQGLILTSSPLLLFGSSSGLLLFLLLEVLNFPDPILQKAEAAFQVHDRRLVVLRLHNRPQRHKQLVAFPARPTGL